MRTFEQGIECATGLPLEHIEIILKEDPNFNFAENYLIRDWYNKNPQYKPLLSEVRQKRYRDSVERDNKRVLDLGFTSGQKIVVKASPVSSYNEYECEILDVWTSNVASILHIQHPKVRETINMPSKYCHPIEDH